MMNKILTIALLMPCMAVAQNASTEITPKVTEATYRYADAIQAWNATANAAAMTIDSTAARGYAEVSAGRTTGSYHRVQEGASQNQLSFYAERYQPMGRYLYGYGSFRFTQSRTDDRAWSDVMRTYESNPFFPGSAVSGEYAGQDFELTARVATVSFDGWRFGMAMDYKVGDLSRLRDPRSRSRLLDYKLTPSVTYTFGSNTIGAAGWYDRRKEKMPTLTTVQNNPNLYYYQMSGLDAVTGTVGGYTGFQREYVNHGFGGELTYGYRTDRFTTVNAVTIGRATDYIYEQYKREPGRYTTVEYGVASHNRLFSQCVMHEVDMSADYVQGYADEYRPQLMITTDPANGYKSYHYENQMTYKKRYQCETLSVKAAYRMNFLAGQGTADAKSIDRFVGVNAHLRTVSQKHLLPTSTFDCRTLTVNAEYGQALLKRSLWLTAEVGYLNAMKADMSLADPASEYAQSVLLKDMAYYDADCLRGKLTVKYEFPVKIKKTTSLLYVKAYGEYFSAKGGLNRSSIGISLGVFN